MTNHSINSHSKQKRFNDSTHHDADFISRRHFVKFTALAGLGMTTLTYPNSQKRILGANDTVRVGIIGIRSKGAHHIKLFRNIDKVRVVAICDVDQEILSRESEKLEQVGEKVDTYVDFRKMLDRNDIDVIVISTPNHWHSLMGIWACQAGKDVYVEKPVSHNVWEGRQLVKAARKYKRIVQAGTQNRSNEGLINTFQYLREGHLGKITLAKGLCYKRRKSIGTVSGPQAIPKHIDYDLWTGPADLEPLMRERVHYDWHWFWNTGNGDFGNQGIHELDLCRWALGENALPQSVYSFGGRYGYIDDAETPNTQVVIFDYQSAPLIFEVRGLPQSSQMNAMDAYRGIRVGVIIQCEHGYFAGGNGGGWIYDNHGKKMKQITGSSDNSHAENFIHAVRSREQSQLNADIEEGHISTALVHLGNISHRLGHLMEFNREEKLSNNERILDTYDHMKKHLVANGVNLEENKMQIGAKLKIDVPNEKFISHESYDQAFFANQMLNRKGRAPFIIPEEV